MVRSAFVTRTHFLVLALLPILWTPAAASSQPIATWAASRMTQSDTGNLVEYLWSKGPKMRAETVIAGRPVVTLVNETRYILIDALSKEGVSIERSEAARRQDAKRGRPFGNEAEKLIAAGAEKIEGGIESGMDASRYRLTNSTGRREIWVTEGEYELPVEIYQYYRNTGSEMRVRYLGWSPGVPLPEWFFEPLPDVTLETLTYTEYVERSKKEAVGPAPPFYAELLHGRRE